MNYPLCDYATIIFDCDGVVLNSNRVKTEAFYEATLSFGETTARAMVDYHVVNGGVSRYAKFAYFLEHIAPNNELHLEPKGLEQLLSDYAASVKQGLLECGMADGLAELREQTKAARWMIVSGGDQAEMRDVLAARGIATFFDRGIFGSPDTKANLLAREIDNGSIQHPAIFLGDSKYDYECARDADLDFVFIHGWTEVVDWQRFVKVEGIASVARVADLLKV